MVMCDGIPPEAKKALIKEERTRIITKMSIEDVLDSYISWVSNADDELRKMDADKIKLLRPILDKFSRGINSLTNELDKSVEEVPSCLPGIDIKDYALKSAAETFYWNKFFDLDYIGNNLKSEIFSNLEGGNLLAEAFDDYKDLDVDLKGEIQSLADSVLKGIYEATQLMCRYNGDYKNEYLYVLEDAVNIFGSDGEVQVVEN